MNSKKIVWLVFGLILIGGFIYIYPTLPFKKKALQFKDIVASNTMNEKVAHGKPYTFTLNKDGLSGQDSVVLVLDGTRFTQVKGEFSIEIPTTSLPLGYHKVNITAYRGDKNKTVELIFYVVSDIQPEQMVHAVTQVINRDTEAYTQGLEIHNGILYESGGQTGQSLIRKVNPNNAQVLKKIKLDGELFAEGLTILNDKVYQLTWQNGICLIYDLELNQLKKINFKSSNGEGWGLCHDGKSLIISDGSNKLTYVNPETFAIEKTISVYAGDRDVQYLNELEYVDGFIYANVYTTNQIIQIEASTGKVLKVADFSDLDKGNPKADVLNGIAWNPASQNFILTGKYWGKLYYVKM